MQPQLVKDCGHIFCKVFVYMLSQASGTVFLNTGGVAMLHSEFGV